MLTVKQNVFLLDMLGIGNGKAETAI